MLENPRPTAPSSTEFVRKCLESVHHAALPKWEAAKQWLEQRRDAPAQIPVVPLSIAPSQEVVKKSLENAYNAALTKWEATKKWLDTATADADWPSEKDVEQWLESRYLASKHFLSATTNVIVSNPNTTAAVLLSVSFWPLPLIIFRQVLGLIGFGIEGVIRGSFASRYQSRAYGAYTPTNSRFAGYQSYGAKPVAFTGPSPTVRLTCLFIAIMILRAPKK